MEQRTKTTKTVENLKCDKRNEKKWLEINFKKTSQNTEEKKEHSRQFNIQKSERENRECGGE